MRKTSIIQNDNGSSIPLLLMLSAISLVLLMSSIKAVSGHKKYINSLRVLDSIERLEATVKYNLKRREQCEDMLKDVIDKKYDPLDESSTTYSVDIPKIYAFNDSSGTLLVSTTDASTDSMGWELDLKVTNIKFQHQGHSSIQNLKYLKSDGSYVNSTKKYFVDLVISGERVRGHAQGRGFSIKIPYMLYVKSTNDKIVGCEQNGGGYVHRAIISRSGLNLEGYRCIDTDIDEKAYKGDSTCIDNNSYESDYTVIPGKPNGFCDYSEDDESDKNRRIATTPHEILSMTTHPSYTLYENHIPSRNEIAVGPPLLPGNEGRCPVSVGNNWNTSSEKIEDIFGICNNCFFIGAFDGITCNEDNGWRMKSCTIHGINRKGVFSQSGPKPFKLDICASQSFISTHAQKKYGRVTTVVTATCEKIMK